MQNMSSKNSCDIRRLLFKKGNDLIETELIILKRKYKIKKVEYFFSKNNILYFFKEGKYKPKHKVNKIKQQNKT